MWPLPRLFEGGGNLSCLDWNLPGPLRFPNSKCAASPVPKIGQGAPQFKKVWSCPRPFQGWFVIRRLKLTVINVCTKFKVSNPTAPKIGKVTQNVENWVIWGNYGSLELIRNNAIRHNVYDILSSFHIITICSYPVPFCDMARYWSKIADLTHPTCIWCPTAAPNAGGVD